MIERTNPDVDYIPPAVFQQLGISHLVSNGSLLFISGVAPFHGPNLDLVGKGDLNAQCRYVLDVLDRSLAAGASSRAHILEWTIYLVDPERKGEIGSMASAITPLILDWLGPHHPAGTAVGALSLFHPEQLIEIRAIAAIAR
jgi:enamine deaminase RidA (YjgF/YER057c/UK114 family)